MSNEASVLAPNAEPFPAQAELDRTVPPPDAIRTLGRVRIPLTVHHAPWATAYLLPDGRVVWCVRLWEHDRPVRRLVRTQLLRDYCRTNGLRAVEASLDLVLAGTPGSPEAP
jgi:hypothetical protein